MEIKKKFVINAAFYGIIFLMVLGVYRYILPIMTPFIIGFCIASVVQIPIKYVKLSNPRHKRFTALFFCFVFYALIVGILSIFGVKLAEQIGNLISAMPNLIKHQLYPFFLEMVDRVEQRFTLVDSALLNWLFEVGNSALESLSQFATNLSAGAVKVVASGAASLPSVIVQIVITVVASFYMSADYQKVVSFVRSLIPENKHHLINNGLGYAKTAVLVYIKSCSMLFCVTFIELWIGLAILRIPYALGIAFAIAIFDLMPILGTGGILLPWGAYLLVTGSIGTGIGLIVLYVVIAAVRNTLEPKFVGSQIGLHPLSTLVAMILGLKLIGLPGMILFPIALVAITHLKQTPAPEADSVQ